LKETNQPVDPNEVRLRIAKKMHDYLFAPMQITNPRMHQTLKASGNIIVELDWLYWALLGTREERKARMVPRPRWDLADFFAQQKVDLFMSQLTPEEEAALYIDIDQLLKMVRSKNYPKKKIQIPLELTGHPGVEPSFGTVMINGTPAMDWGLGGSLTTRDGKSYLLFVLETLKAELSRQSAQAVKLSDKELNELYFYGIVYKEPEPFKPHKDSHFRRGEFADFDKFKKFMKSLREK
jgi:hypothetical protein